MVYQEKPILLTELWARVLREMGFTHRHAPVLAVIAQRQCDADGLPRDQLQ
jgi:hypothetical protein